MLSVPLNYTNEKSKTTIFSKWVYTKCFAIFLIYEENILESKV